MRERSGVRDESIKIKTHPKLSKALQVLLETPRPVPEVVFLIRVAVTITYRRESQILGPQNQIFILRS